MSFTNHIVRVLRRCSGQKQHALHIVRACRELIYQDFSTRFSRSKNKLFWLVFPFIFVTTFFLFYPSLNYYFFQDDWFVLNWIRIGDFASFFQFRTDIIYWRPLSMPIFFKINQSFFGLNPMGYHSVALIFHLINTFLIYQLFKTLKFAKVISLILSLMYATASFHFMSLSWLSTTSYVIGPTFIFATLLLLLKNNLPFAIFTFLLALASSELALTIVPMSLVLNKKERSGLIKLWPFLIIALIYLALRFLIFKTPATGQYQIMFDPQIIRSLFWYFVWFFNMPEFTSTIFFFSRLKPSIIALVPFARYLILPLILVIYFAGSAFFTKQDIKIFLRGFALFVIGLLPIIFFPKHIYPMYLVVASIGIFFVIGKVLETAKNNLYGLALIVLWITSSFLTLSFYRSSHWLVNEQVISKAYVNYLNDLTPTPFPNSVFIFKDANIAFAKKHNFVLVETEDILRQSLNDQDAVQVLYNDSSLRSVFKTTRGSQSPAGGAKVYEIVPRVD